MQHNKPLYSFEDNADYVYDVMWSPVHPALFACVDGMGRLDLWNLNNDTEVRRGEDRFLGVEGAGDFLAIVFFLTFAKETGEEKWAVLPS